MLFPRPCPVPSVFNNFSSSFEHLQSDVMPIKIKQNQSPEEVVTSCIMKMPIGARCIIRVTWKEGDLRHVFIGQRLKDRVVFLDPQAQGYVANINCSKYFDRISKKGVYIMRIDDKKFTEEAKCCITRRPEE